MATLAELDIAGYIHKLDPDLDEDQQEERLIYASPRLRHWIQNDLPGLGSTWKIETTPEDQFDDYVAMFASGERLTYSWHFKPIKPIGYGIWELKMPDLRIIGFFHRMDCFVGFVGDTKQRIIDHGLYGGYRGEAVHFRSGLHLDEPKFITSENPYDVISNYDFP